MKQKHAEMADSAWKPLYRIGGVAALIALRLFQLGQGGSLEETKRN